MIYKVIRVDTNKRQTERAACFLEAQSQPEADAPLAQKFVIGSDPSERSERVEGESKSDPSDAGSVARPAKGDGDVAR